MSYFHCVKWGILGVRTVHGFGSDWGDLGEDRLIGESLQRGSAWETLGEPPTSELRHLGYNRYHQKKLGYKLVYLAFSVTNDPDIQF